VRIGYATVAAAVDAPSYRVRQPTLPTSAERVSRSLREATSRLTADSRASGSEAEGGSALSANASPPNTWRSQWVIIPEFTLRVFRHGNVVLTERVVTGQPHLQTPILSAKMESIVFPPCLGRAGLLRGRGARALWTVIPGPRH
jgi:hypothetical protein